MCLGLFLSFSLKLRSFILIYLIFCSYINCYLLTPLVYWINRNRKKDESNKNPISILLHTLVRIGPFPCLLFSLHLMHMLNVVFWVCMLWNRISHMVRNYHFTISLKMGPVKILARSSISPGSQTKVNVKVIASR